MNENNYLDYFFSLVGDQLMTCSNIDYFSGEEYHPDPNDSTLAIPCKCN